MSLKEQLMADMKTAMREKDRIRKSTITMVRAAILQSEKDNKIELSEEEVLGVIAKQVKQRKDALEEFEKAQREDLMEQTNKELEILMDYLPKQLTEAEVKNIVSSTIDEVGATTIKDMGKVMGAVLPKVKGRADGALINKYVKELLNT
ncbi:GatB/YqeY domain-containing protein [Alkalibacter rhizosphaerae]|uniref:GatB/YqeY domain-containing protein n=1 Tax=Alkalibacter rhizosphaerae TaxID=2815577 RepID=A0A975AHF3_9FIRM|nr:GatB/YqeY domain-containing protein [Alkalibacter rhizosphaerae]QSX08392.1 GatB/YqeY domain-containing protein [Alkalibacter rhizosphaerae]